MLKTGPEVMNRNDSESTVRVERDTISIAAGAEMGVSFRVSGSRDQRHPRFVYIR